jgi:hypothetical protein
MDRPDSAALTETIVEYVDRGQEFVWGISDGEVFERSAPTVAAISG